MRKYKVIVEIIKDVTFEIEAEDELHAKQIAHDEVEFEHSPYERMNIWNVEEVTDEEVS